MFQFNKLHTLQVAVVLRDVLDHVLVAEVGEVVRVVLVFLLEAIAFLGSEEMGHMGVVLVGHTVQDALGAQSAMGLHLVA